MHPCKITAIALLNFEPFLNLFQDVLFIQLSSAVLGQACDGGLCGIPVALSVQGQVRGLIRQATQRISEDGDILSWLHAAKLDLTLGKSPVRVAWIGGRAKIDRAGNAP